MRLISRTALGAAAAAVLAVTAVAPSVATPQDGAVGNSGESGKRPVVGSDAAQQKRGQTDTVTPVTGSPSAST